MVVLRRYYVLIRYMLLKQPPKECLKKKVESFGTRKAQERVLRW